MLTILVVIEFRRYVSHHRDDLSGVVQRSVITLAVFEVLLKLA